MSELQRWFRHLFAPGRRPSGRPPSVRPRLEHLETRRLLSATVIQASRSVTEDPLVFAIVGSAGNSLWEYNVNFTPSGPADSHWAEITPAAVSQVTVSHDSAGNVAVFALIASDNNSLWEYDPAFSPNNPVNMHWAEITTASVSQISANNGSWGNPAPVVFAVVGSAGNSLWEYNPQFNSGGAIDSHWAQITPAAVSQISAARNTNGDPVVFAAIASAGNSLWEYNPQFSPGNPVNMHWARITTASVSQISAVQDLSSGSGPTVFATLASAGNSLWEYNPAFNSPGAVDAHWQELTSASVDQISATWDSNFHAMVFATIGSAGDSLWEYDPNTNPSGTVDQHWQELTPAAVSHISGIQEYAHDYNPPYYPVVYATLASAGNSLWKYDSKDNPNWSELTAASVG
jgi:hypothetical protein